MMVDRSDVRDGMEVVGSDGVAIGRVRDVEGGRMTVAPDADPATGAPGRRANGATEYAGARTIPLSHVRTVEDGRVHLLDSARVETGGLTARIAEATGDPDPAHPHAPAGRGTLRWVLGGLVFLLVLLGLYTCTRSEQRDELARPPQIERGDVSPVGAGGPQTVALPDGRSVRLDPLGQAMQVNNYLADPQGATPRSFPFDRLNFDTGSAAIRPEDRPTVDALGQVLAAYPNARVRVVGFADARGPAPANADLGKRRAEAVVAALAGQGVARDRMEAASGGEGTPAATNATAPGRAENRRTELVVLAR